MPIKKSAIKAMNRSQTLAKRKFLKGVEAKEALTVEDLANVYKAIDKAAKVGVIKKRNASRKKSRISKAFDTLKK